MEHLNVFKPKYFRPFQVINTEILPAVFYHGTPKEQDNSEILVIPYFELVQRTAYFEAKNNYFTLIVVIEQDLNPQTIEKGLESPFLNSLIYVYHPDRFFALSATLQYFKGKKIRVQSHLMQGYYTMRLNFIRLYFGNLLDLSAYLPNIETVTHLYEKSIKLNVYKINKGRFIQEKGIVHLQKLLNLIHNLLLQPHIVTDSLADLIKHLGKSEVYFRFGFYLQITYFKAIFNAKNQSAYLPYYQAIYNQLLQQFKSYKILIHQINFILINYYRNSFINIKMADRLILIDKMIKSKFRDLLGRHEIHISIEYFKYIESSTILLSWTQLALNHGILKAKLYVANNKIQNVSRRSTTEFNMFLFHLDLALKEANYLLNMQKNAPPGSLDAEPFEKELRNMVKELFRSKLYLDMVNQ